MAYIEIEDGPYLVLPAEEAFDNGERPVNIDQSNLVWLDASDVVWVDPSVASASTTAPNVAFLWGEPQDSQLNGTFIKLPIDFTGEIHSYGSTFRAVVVEGNPTYLSGDTAGRKSLEPGSYSRRQLR